MPNKHDALMSDVVADLASAYRGLHMDTSAPRYCRHSTPVAAKKNRLLRGRRKAKQARKARRANR